MTTNIETHNKAVEYAACNLIENGISTVSGTERGIDLITTDGKKILVRGVSGEVAIPLMNGSLDTLKADHLVIITNMEYNCSKKIYIMTMDEAKKVSANSPYKANGRNNYFIESRVYRYHREEYSVLK